MEKHAPSPAEELAILFPERTETIAGVAVTMREYGFAESLRHASLIATFTDALTELGLQGRFHDLDGLRDAFGQCHDTVLQLIALACDQPLAWVAGLAAEPGEVLLTLWWGVNSDFFLRRVLLSLRLRMVRRLAGRTSPPPSSPPATTPAPSVGIPAAS